MDSIAKSAGFNLLAYTFPIVHDLKSTKISLENFNSMKNNIQCIPIYRTGGDISLCDEWKIISNEEDVKFYITADDDVSLVVNGVSHKIKILNVIENEKYISVTLIFTSTKNIPFKFVRFK